jgi:hypothetical protein
MVAMMAGGIIASLFLLARLAWWQLRRPVLTSDSWVFVDYDNHQLLQWLFSQHNEHRIVLAKLSTLIETRLFGLLPTSTALFQNLFLLLLSSGFLALCCHRLLTRRHNQLLTWLACTLVMVNPWHGENFAWEFQVPWFWTNSLVFAATLLLVCWGQDISPPRRRMLLVAAAALPWAAIYSSGQGFALSISLCLVSLLMSRKLSAVLIGSTLLSSLVYFFILGYTRPAYHPPPMFNPDFFAKAILGGPWQGLSIIVLTLGGYLILLGNQSFLKSDGRNSIAVSGSRRYLPALFPGIFALVFVSMITTSRSGFGLAQADNARYLTHTLLLAVSLIMLSAIASDIQQSPLTSRSASPDIRSLFPSFIVILSTLFSFPQVVTRQAPLFKEAWTNVIVQRVMWVKTFRCIARKAKYNNASQVSAEVKHCNATLQNIHPGVLSIGLRYFSGKTVVKPSGWHSRLADETSPDI